jgi:dihydropyrimidinase
VHGLPQKGRLEPARDADIVLFDPAAKRRLSAGILHSAIDHSTYDGQEVRGWPVVTISRGRVIADRGEWLGEPGRGRFLRRSIAST